METIVVVIDDTGYYLEQVFLIFSAHYYCNLFLLYFYGLCISGRRITTNRHTGTVIET